MFDSLYNGFSVSLFPEHIGTPRKQFEHIFSHWSTTSMMLRHANLSTALKITSYNNAKITS